MATRNLEPGQFQIGDLIMGEWTLYKVESVDIGNYDVNVQDSQSAASNELTFGIDTFKPAPMTLTIHVMINKVLENVVALTNSSKIFNFEDDPGLDDLQSEWRAEETLMEWGEMKPLYFCAADGIVRQFFGRPGKFSYTKPRIVGPEYYTCTAEFRRADTLAFSEQEWYVEFEPNAPQTISLTNGTAPSWVRFLIYGPANHPVINFGDKQIELDWDIAAGKAVEITSYPWLGRRVVDSDGLSLAAYLIINGDPYLDKVRFFNKTSKLISWNATGLDSNSKMVLLWHDGYQVMP